MPEDVTVKDTSTDTSSINPSTVTHPPKDYRLVNLVVNPQLEDAILANLHI